VGASTVPSGVLPARTTLASTLSPAVASLRCGMRVTVSAALVGCVLLAGCGGERSGSAGRERFMVAADAICSRFPGPLVGADAVGADAVGEGRGGTFADRSGRFAEAVGRGVVSLERLGVPRSAQRASAQAVVDAMRRAGRSVVHLRVATDELQEAHPTDVARVDALIAKVGALAPR
jgi:hypothetical protein